MLKQGKKKDKMHLTNLIGKRSNSTPNFALLLGAGASVSSGVKPTYEMIAEWRRQLYAQSKSKQSLDEWLSQQDWYQDEEEYSILFEKVYDQRSQRRIYIEECVRNAKPSWGYIYLANAIAHNYFNVIFTPNFDDLLNEACFLYADCRPIACAHDSAVADIRVTSARPKIIKLHGDFLYDSIKNTVRETETLEKNMRDKFMQFAREYGLIVIGYGGNDRSIMDILDALLMTDGYFPNGLYWCTRNGDTLSKKVERLMRREKAYWVEIEGFDEFMAELHRGLGLILPDAVRDPYKATTEKLNRFIEARKETKHKIIKSDCAELEKQVKKFEQVISGKLPIKESDRLTPYRFLGDIEYDNRNDYEKALKYYERALLQDANDVDLMQKIAFSYAWTERFEKAVQMCERMIRQAPTDFRGYWCKGACLEHLDKMDDALESFNVALKYATKFGRFLVLSSRSNLFLLTGKWKEALADAEAALQIRYSDSVSVNKCIALKKLNREKEATQILESILPKIEQNYYRACAFAFLGDKKKMLKELEAAIKEDIRFKVDAEKDPDFADYREDSDFKKLLKKYKRTK